MATISSHVYVYWLKKLLRTVYGNSNGFEVKVIVLTNKQRNKQRDFVGSIHLAVLCYADVN